MLNRRIPGHVFAYECRILLYASFLKRCRYKNIIVAGYSVKRIKTVLKCDPYKFVSFSSLAIDLSTTKTFVNVLEYAKVTTTKCSTITLASSIL